MRRRIIHLRLLVTDNFTLIIVALFVLVALGGFATYVTYVDPATQTETQTVSSWESAGEFTHQATVTNGTRTFDPGAVLRNRTVYLQRVSPRMNGSFTYEYAATQDGNLTATATLAIIIRSVKETHDGNETIYWRIERPLKRTEIEGLEPDERVQLPFSVNVSALKQRANNIEQRVGDPPGMPQVHLLASVDLSGSRNGQAVDRTRLYRLPIEFEQSAYRVQDMGPRQDSGRQTRKVTVAVTPGPLRSVGGPVLLFVSGCGLVSLIFSRWTGHLTVSKTERDWLAFRSDREEFDDWITTGRVPAEAISHPCIEVESLSGLVDTAIDTDERVIEDPHCNQYVVISNTIRYVYKPPSSSDAETRLEEPTENGLTAEQAEQPATDGSG